VSELKLGRVAVFSKGIQAIPHLAELLGASALVDRPDARATATSLDSVAGWGFKATARRARVFANRNGLAYVALEDGFLRSAGNAVVKPPPISIVLDDVGIYYEARSPSRLETLVAEAASDSVLSAAGREMRQRVLDWKLTKYNTVGGESLDRVLPRRRKIMIVDQTLGDQAVEGAGAEASTFPRMVTTAMSVAEARDIVVKVHPDVIAGRSRGYLDREARQYGIDIIADTVNPHDLFERVDEIWTVSSGLGFEALVAGKTVRCFAAPFYAGWGLTDDSRAEPAAKAWLVRRAGARVDIDALAAAAYVSYPNYADPITFERLTPFAAAERLVEFRARYAAEVKNRVCVGFRGERRQAITRLHAGGSATVDFVPAKDAVTRAAETKADLMVWGDKVARRLEPRAAKAGVTIWRVAGGTLRVPETVKPTGDFHSLVEDDIGIYFDSTRPSRFEQIAGEAAFGPEIEARAHALRGRLAAFRDAAPADPTAQAVRAAAGGRRIVVVLGEIPKWAGQRWGAFGVQSNEMLLGSVRGERPEAFVVYAEHPDLVARRRPGWLPDSALKPHADLIVRTGNATGLLAAADELHTMTSNLGFEALLRGLHVVCWGVPFYAGWGLTDDRLPVARRSRRLTLDQLAAAALILYPRYVDPVSGIPCEVEDILRGFERSGEAVKVATPPLGRRVRKKLQQLEIMVRHGIFRLRRKKG
jgi:capsular polysaccharide export protein